jgi:hypothetical protein
VRRHVLQRAVHSHACLHALRRGADGRTERHGGGYALPRHGHRSAIIVAVKARRQKLAKLRRHDANREQGTGRDFKLSRALRWCSSSWLWLINVMEQPLQSSDRVCDDWGEATRRVVEAVRVAYWHRSDIASSGSIALRAACSEISRQQLSEGSTMCNCAFAAPYIDLCSSPNVERGMQNC